MTKICETCKKPYEVDKHNPRQKHCTACANGRRNGKLRRGAKWDKPEGFDRPIDKIEELPF
jgi:hypothetical protein